MSRLPSPESSTLDNTDGTASLVPPRLGADHDVCLLGGSDAGMSGPQSRVGPLRHGTCRSDHSGDLHREVLAPPVIGGETRRPSSLSAPGSNDRCRGRTGVVRVVPHVGRGRGTPGVGTEGRRDWDVKGRRKSPALRYPCAVDTLARRPPAGRDCSTLVRSRLVVLLGRRHSRFGRGTQERVDGPDGTMGLRSPEDPPSDWATDTRLCFLL